MAKPVREREDLNNLLDVLSQLGYELYSDFAKVQYQWGLRFGDCATITHDDYRYLLAHGCVFLNESKTGKERPLSGNSVVMDVLSKYFNADSLGNSVIWGKRIIRETYNLKLKQAAEIVGLDSDSISSHTLRKSFGYHLRQKGVSLDSISEHYGHSNTAITRRYAGLDVQDKLLLTAVPL